MNRTVTVKGTDLTRVLVNMDLWLLSGYLHVDEDGIRGYATDGFVAMADACDLQGKSENWLPGDDYLYKVDEEDVDHLLLITRKIGAKNIELICADSGLVVDGYGFENTEPDQDKKPKWVLDVNPEEESSFGSEEKEAPEWVHLLLDSLTYQGEAVSVSTLAFRPERFLKLSRVRSDNLAPIDMVFVSPIHSEAGPMVLVKIGYTFRALVNSVNREKAISNLQDGQEVWFWGTTVHQDLGKSDE